MCGKASSSKVLKGARTLRADTAHCRIGEKTKQKQPTDRAAHCGLLSGPLAVVFCSPPLIALPSSLQHAPMRLPMKLQPRMPTETSGISTVSRLPRIARADLHGAVSDEHTGRWIITAAQLLKR
jgi:hypothetical protein